MLAPEGDDNGRTAEMPEVAENTIEIHQYEVALRAKLSQLETGVRRLDAIQSRHRPTVWIVQRLPMTVTLQRAGSCRLLHCS